MISSFHVQPHKMASFSTQFARRRFVHTENQRRSGQGQKLGCDFLVRKGDSGNIIVIGKRADICFQHARDISRLKGRKKLLMCLTNFYYLTHGVFRQNLLIYFARCTGPDSLFYQIPRGRLQHACKSLNNAHT
jgi:hypothetical protein